MPVSIVVVISHTLLWQGIGHLQYCTGRNRHAILMETRDYVMTAQLGTHLGDELHVEGSRHLQLATNRAADELDLLQRHFVQILRRRHQARVT